MLRVGDREQVGQHGAAVPEAVAVRARLVFPGVAPERAGQNHYAGRTSNVPLGASRLDQQRTEVSRAELAKRVIVGAVVVDARGQTSLARARVWPAGIGPRR